MTELEISARELAVGLLRAKLKVVLLKGKIGVLLKLIPLNVIEGLGLELDSSTLLEVIGV